MAADKPPAQSDVQFAWGLLATSYLLECRGPELELCLASSTSPELRNRLRGALCALQHEDRDRRVAGLAPGVALLRRELHKQRWTP